MTNEEVGTSRIPQIVPDDTFYCDAVNAMRIQSFLLEPRKARFLSLDVRECSETVNALTDVDQFSASLQLQNSTDRFMPSSKNEDTG